MKSCFRFILILVCLTVSAVGEEIKFSDIEPGKEYVIHLEQVARPVPGDVTGMYYRLAQGSATDGRYAYVATLRRNVNGGLMKVDLQDGSIVSMAHGLEFGHANDLVYNTKTNKLYAVHLDQPHPNKLVSIDPDTLEINGEVVLRFPFYAVAYNETRDQYAFGRGGGYNIVLTDGEFNYLKLLPGVNTGLTRQGMDCDDKHIYFLHWDSKNHKSQMMVYDWEGHHINTVKINHYIEVESMFHIGDDYYITFLSDYPRIYKASVAEQ
ncbi:MAG: hypothetical protein IKW00_09235 [Clostridia bacterium]|nr:hypothetical protein [Clostridia bacterium]